MPSEPIWLSVGDLVKLNRDLVADTGEPHRVLKPDDLESACERPRWLWHYDGVQDVVVLAARLLFAVADAHAFIQGNKRTGFVAAVMFLQANGWALDPSLDSDELGDAIIDVLCDRTSEASFCDWISDFIEPA